MTYRRSKRDVLSVHVNKDLGKICTEDEKSQSSTEGKEREEISIISAPNAIINPNAVVVLRLNTVIADSTVVTSRWSPYITSLAIFGWHFHCSRGRLCRLDHRPIVRWGCQSERIFVLVRRWHGMKVSGENLARLVGIWACKYRRTYSRVRDGSVNEGGHADVENVCKYNGYRG